MSKLSVARFAAAGGLTAAILFVLCWVGAVIWPAAVTHAFVTLFTPAPIQSGLALGQGACGALLFGLLAGAAWAISFNVTAGLERKPN